METFEKVVFRMQRRPNPYTGREVCIATFPEDEANRGRVAYLAFEFINGRPVFEPYAEMDLSYYYHDTKLIHKGTPQAAACLKAIEDYYGTRFTVREKLY